MTEEVPKKPEHVEGPHKPADKTKISDTAKESDQTERTRALRAEMQKRDAAFSVANPGAKHARFELTDDRGNRVAAAARGNAVEAPVKPAPGNDHPQNHPAHPVARGLEIPISAVPAAARTGDAPAAPVPAVARPGDVPAAPVPAKPVDLAAAAKDAEAIRKATGNDNYVARWADQDAINKILEGKTEGERKDRCRLQTKVWAWAGSRNAGV